MWRLILVSFAFLGWAFYQLSGGADYAPRADSLQVAMRETGLFATPDPVAVAPIRVAEAAPDALPPPIEPRRRTGDRAARPEPYDRDETVSRAMASLSNLSIASVDGFNIDLRDTPVSYDVDPELGLSGGLSDATVAQDADLAGLSIVRPVRAGYEPEASAGYDEVSFDQPAQEPFANAPAARDDSGGLRSTIAGDNANMRAGPGIDFAAVDQLNSGTPVEILETSGDGWVRLRTLDSGSEGWMADWLVTASF